MSERVVNIKEIKELIDSKVELYMEWRNLGLISETEFREARRILNGFYEQIQLRATNKETA